MNSYPPEQFPVGPRSDPFAEVLAMIQARNAQRMRQEAMLGARSGLRYRLGRYAARPVDPMGRPMDDYSIPGDTTDYGISVRPSVLQYFMDYFRPMMPRR